MTKLSSPVDLTQPLHINNIIFLSPSLFYNSDEEINENTPIPLSLLVRDGNFL